MKKGFKITLIVIAIIIFLLLINLLFIHSYKPLRIDKDFFNKETNERCGTYYQSCTYIGTLIQLKSFPIKYDCKGWELCKDINEIKCGIYSISDEN